MLSEGLHLVRALQPECRQFGYHLCLGGGVLNKGQSEKDLDLYFLPMGTEPTKPAELIQLLDRLWGKGTDLFKEYEQKAKSNGMNHVYVFDANDFEVFKRAALKEGSWSRCNVVVEPALNGGFVYRVTISDFLEEKDTDNKNNPYSYKLKYERSGDRIDVFIIGEREPVVAKDKDIREVLGLD